MGGALLFNHINFIVYAPTGVSIDAALQHNAKGWLDAADDDVHQITSFKLHSGPLVD